MSRYRGVLAPSELADMLNYAIGLTISVFVAKCWTQEQRGKVELWCESVLRGERVLPKREFGVDRVRLMPLEVRGLVDARNVPHGTL